MSIKYNEKIILRLLIKIHLGGLCLKSVNLGLPSRLRVNGQNSVNLVEIPIKSVLSD